MKSTERRHLKDNELAQFAARSRQVIEERRNQLTWITGAIVALAVIGGGYYFWRTSVANQADRLLADARIVEEAPVGPITDPKAADNRLRFPDGTAKVQAAVTKYKGVADAYPSTDAGIFARYREATGYMFLGQPAQAVAAFQQVIDRDGNGIYGQMARLGLAQAEARSGALDKAIATYQSLADQKDGALPVDGVLIELGRAYLEAGKTTEAQQTFNRVVSEFPDSQFLPEARQQLDSLKKA